MTGLDCLKEELKRRGMTKTQYESKVVPVVLDILANADTNHTEEYQKKADLEKLDSAINNAWHDLNNLKEMYKYEYARISEWKKEVEAWKKEVEAYIEELKSSMEICETPEGKDKLKLAQMYINSVDVDTKYDNTAFIIGLAAVLSNGEIAPIHELRKINKKIPEPNFSKYFLRYFDKAR